VWRSGVSVRRAEHRRGDRMNRRALLGTVAAFAALVLDQGFAQIPARRVVIGFLVTTSKAQGARFFSGLPLGMRELGYLEGRDYVFEDRYADNDASRLPALARELVRLNPSVIVASSTTASLALKEASATIPIVGTSLTDPVGTGLVVSEARPGGNVTGVLVRVEGLPGKYVEIARDAIPGASKIGLLVNATEPSNLLQLREAESVAAKLGLALVPVQIRAVDEVGPAFQTFTRERANIVIVLGDPVFLGLRRQIAAFALAARLPTVFNYREHVEDGGLLSYGIDLRANYRRAAYFVDRIIKGEKPADLPVEFPTKLEMVINNATAKALGLTIPPSILIRADEVIDRLQLSIRRC
jgi:ABC-type uncharacterized transport system substrate-binding protein